ncbi:MAG: DUF4150 domain-containing protein [Rhodothermales bacterium]|nr:DUF4150 domain-containing protein [Rhodothermales bacterium]
MSNKVFANGFEIACKKASGKSICAFPDVVWTPPDKVPPTPTGVPIPYPNTAMASDTSKGSKKVKITGAEVMLKNKSCYKKSMGDEAGVAQLKGFVTMKNRGKVYYVKWSMDVKIEGQNVDRHFDLTTHNHGSMPGNTPPWPYMDSMAIENGNSDDPCQKDKQNEADACDKLNMSHDEICEKAGLGNRKMESNDDAIANGYSGGIAEWKETMTKNASANNEHAECVRARRCKLVPYKPDGCCKSQSADHVIPKSSFYKTSVKDGTKVRGWSGNKKKSGYKPDKAPCMCAEGTSNVGGSHGLRHSIHKLKGTDAGVAEGQMVDFDEELERCASSSCEISKSPECSQECIEAQLREGHKSMGKSKKIKHSPSGNEMSQAEVDAIKTDYSSAASPR